MIIHLDMDAFFASVELRQRPELAGKPVVVGGSASGRGVVAAASYAARQFGVRSAMPVSTALKLCPDLVCLPVNMPLYIQVSQQIQSIFYRYTPEIEPLSLDEAFLDVRASERLFGPAADIARKIKHDVATECQLIVSAGVAPNKFVAKIASDIDKPDGFVVVQADEMQAFLDPLPVKRLWGVGKKTEQVLLKAGLKTVRDVRHQEPQWLMQRLGKMGDHIYRLAHGLDKRKVISDARAKSLSSETTFDTDTRDEIFLFGVLSQLVEQLAARVRTQALKGHTISIKVRFSDFRTLSRSRTLSEACCNTKPIWQTSQSLLKQVLQKEKDPIRLLGVSVSGFDHQQQHQPDLFEDDVHRDKLDQVRDDINQRFGSTGIHRGRKLKK